MIRVRTALLCVALIVSRVGVFIVRAQSQPKVMISANVELVQIPVVVLDQDGAVPKNLQKTDFRITEDGIEQRVLYCDRHRESVSFVILDDISQSMATKIPFVREATASVLEPVYPQENYQDEFALFGIESRVIRLTPFTTDEPDLERRLPTLLLPTDGSTALYDGIYAGVSVAQREAENKRRAVIIISDGGDNHSRYSLRETQKLLEEAGMPVFAVMAGPLFKFSQVLELPHKMIQNHKTQPQIAVPSGEVIGPAEREGPRNLKALTEVTGGGVFTARDLQDLSRISRTISIAVRYQYLISFKPQIRQERKQKSDTWHSVRLELNPKGRFQGYSIYYRHGYYRAD
jgi:Ca-activated chloride channel homolog